MYRIPQDDRITVQLGGSAEADRVTVGICGLISC
jgi:hypothetical protein